MNTKQFFNRRRTMTRKVIGLSVRMKPGILTYFTAVVAFSTLAIPLALSGQASEQQPRYTVTKLSSLGGTFTEANGLSNRGWIAGFSNLLGDQYQHAALWRNRVLTDLGTLGGYNSFVFFPVKDNRGLIVGGSETSTVDPLAENFCGYGTNLECVGFLWQDGVMRPLPTLGGNNGVALNVNDRAQVAGYAETPIQDPRCTSPQMLDFEAVVWSPQQGKIQELPPLPGDLTAAAIGINDKDQVVGVSLPNCAPPNTSMTIRVVLWENGSVTDLGNLGGVANNVPFAINNLGEVAGQSDVAGDAYQHAFLWSKRDGMQDLGMLPGDVGANALGLNNKGQVVGSSCRQGTCNSNGNRAFLWQQGVMMDLNALVPPNSGLHLFAAADINDRGEIAGMAFDSTGLVVGYLALPCDEQHANNEGCEHQAEGTNAALSETSERPKVTLPENVREQLRQRRGFGRLSVPSVGSQ